MKNFALAIVLMASSVAGAASTPRVVFFGDDFLYQWQNSGAFPDEPGWTGQGFSTVGRTINGQPNGQSGFFGSNYMVANFQTKVVALHPAIVVIMAGASDAAIVEYLPQFPTEGALLQNFAKNVTSMVAQAKAANIKVILTTVQTFPPGIDDQPGAVLLFNEWIEQFGQANGIQVVNFHNLLCGCLETVAGPEYVDVFTAQYSQNGPGPFSNPGNNQVPSAAGYQAMNELMSEIIVLAQTKLIGGYLSNEISEIGVSDQPPNQNNVPIGTTLQFVPQAIYSNGQTIPVINTAPGVGYIENTNTDLDGHVGTWFTTNPAVMTVSQEGLAFAVGPGKANIMFYNSAGVRFSQWDMTVTGW